MNDAAGPGPAKQLPPYWSTDEERLLHIIDFAAEVRKHIQTDQKPPEKAKWLNFLESAGGTALISVLLGGLLGQMISCSIQKSQKEREFQQSWMQARGNQALVAYSEYVKQEQEFVKNTFDQVGQSIAASQDLIDITTQKFDPNKFPKGVERTRVINQKAASRHAFNDANFKWRSSRDRTRLLMAFYHHGQPQVLAAWNQADSSVADLMGCAQDEYIKYLTSGVLVTEEVAQKNCETQEKSLQKAVDHLSGALQSASAEAWQGWQSPDELMQKLRTAEAK